MRLPWYNYVSYCRQLSAILLIVINKITDSYQQHYWQLSTISLFGRKPKPVSYIIYIRTVTIICFIHPFVYLYRQKQLNHTVSCFIYMKIKEYSMRLTYIYHSGFAIETEGYTILIDYFKDTGKHRIRDLSTMNCFDARVHYIYYPPISIRIISTRTSWNGKRLSRISNIFSPKIFWNATGRQPKMLFTLRKGTFLKMKISVSGHSVRLM